jgi:hypothetical protein
MTIKEKLEDYDLYDQAITRHGMLECIRDYEVIGYLSGLDFDSEVQYVFKGCIKVDFQVKVAPEHYSMDDRLLELDRQDEPDYPVKYIWGANYAVVYPGWTLNQDTDELKILEKAYGLKFHEIKFETNAYDLTITFHDLDTKELKRIDRKKNAL